MRLLKTFSVLLAVAALLFTACNKERDLRTFSNGNAPTLTASAATIAPTATDSNNVALTLTWTDPQHATDSANVKFTVEIDSTGKNFSNPARRVIIGKQLTTSFTAKELNTILLDRGYRFNIPVDMDVRVISSYVNNNERLASNVVKIRMTPYLVPPKVALPVTRRLFIVGSATQGGWNNPVPVPSQELARIDSTTWGGVFQLNGGSEYLLLPTNGDWGSKFAVQNNSLPGLAQGGEFGFNVGNSFNANFPGPAASGLYKITVDFQSGRFTVTPYTMQHGLPDQLYIVGGATPGGWNNPVPVPSQQFVRKNASQFEIASLALTGGEQYLLLPTNGDWSRKFGVESTGAPNIALGAPIVPEGQNIPAPAQSGNYRITVDFFTGRYTLVRL